MGAPDVASGGRPMEWCQYTQQLVGNSVKGDRDDIFVFFHRAATDNYHMSDTDRLIALVPIAFYSFVVT